MEHEENPALGYRGIRICLTQPEVFKTQLRALFRASAFGKIAIMYPMITSIREIERIKEIVEAVKGELDREGIRAGICGELGADQSLTKEFLAMGVDELSVSPGSILPIRKILLGTNVQEYRAGK